MPNFDHDLSIAMEQWFDLADNEETRDGPECDGCGAAWPICLLQKHPVTGEVLCPDCWRKETVE